MASVSYRSRGNVLVIAGAARERAAAAAEALAATLPVTLLDVAPRAAAEFTPWTGALESLTGYLGEFTATVAGLNGAAAPLPARFDLVLDFSAEPRFAMRQPPQGYFIAPADEAALAGVLGEIREGVGEFEKPRYFAYRESICAHSRSQVTGCNACIEICSTQAIQPDGDHVKVDPHLCMGCGACSTVCPSGAMSYQFPRVADRGAQMKQLLTAYRHAGGEPTPASSFTTARRARPPRGGGGLGSRLARARCRSRPGTWPRSGSISCFPRWRSERARSWCLRPAPRTANTSRRCARRWRSGRRSCRGWATAARISRSSRRRDPRAGRARSRSCPAQAPAAPATFLLANDKRTAIEFAVEHLAKHAPVKVDEIALPAGAPFGEVLVDKARCTMCMACVGACPESALMDGVDQPLLKFLERNCVQCGLCEATCPEDAIELSPRLLLTPAVREARVLNETQPFHCVSCSKPFGTKQMVDAMLGRLAGHSMFSEAGALRRLQMCADCRVVDMMSSKNEVSVLRLGADS